MPRILRILDANANRAREALRVMEESARFLLNDAPLSRDLKQLRHDLAGVLSRVPNLQADRDTTGDVGTTQTTPAEVTRHSAAHVALAAGKRLGEALRALEEYAKLLPPPEVDATAAIKQLRYRAYTLEQRLNAAMAHTAARQWRVCLLLTESLCALPWRDVLTQALDAGVDCVQLREKTMDSAALLDRAREVVSICHSRQASVIINDRVDLALLSGADGVHLGQTDLPAPEARRLAGNQLIVGLSTTDLDEARRARDAGVDYVGLGPMFPTTTKHKPVLAGPAYAASFLGEDYFRGLPHLAVGGISADNIAQLTAVGVKGVAVSSAVCASETPGDMVRHILAALTTTPPFSAAT